MSFNAVVRCACLMDVCPNYIKTVSHEVVVVVKWSPDTMEEAYDHMCGVPCSNQCWIVLEFDRELVLDH
jgi:hypothetical protein